MCCRKRLSGFMKSGILIIDKPKGVTSHDLVAAVRSRLGMRRVGHAGTLDPMATGVLIIGFGHATRLLNVIVGHDKTYETTIRLGQSTDTDDAEGKFLPSSVEVTDRINQLDQNQIERIITDRFMGHIQQVPNTYSAIKVDGKRAYDLARQGQEVQLASRAVTINEYTILNFRRDFVASSGQPVIDIRARISCSSGTYIRALGRDLGQELGVGGYLTELRRTRIGKFDLSDPTISQHVLTAHVEPRTFKDKQGIERSRLKAVIDQDTPHILASAFTNVAGAAMVMPVLSVSVEQAEALEHGQFLPIALEEATAAVLTSEGGQERLVALLEPRGQYAAKPSVVFPSDIS